MTSRLLLILCLAFASQAQPYTIDVAHRFYATPAEEAAAVKSIDATIVDLTSRSGRLADSPAALEKTLIAYESLLVAVNRYDALLTLRYATDTTNGSARDASRALDERFEAVDTAVRQELAAIPETKLAKWLARRSLHPYAYFLRSLRPLWPHAKDVCDTPRDDWQSDLRDLVLADVPRIPTDLDAAAREVATAKHYEALAKKRDVVAFALIHLANARNAASRSRGFPDAATEAYARSGWTRADVDALLQAIAERVASYARYQELRAARVVAPDAPKPHFTIDEARTLLLDVLAPLGPTYAAELTKLLDPASRRLDVLPGPHRRRGGFSLGFIGTDSVFYTAGFAGTYNDLRVLTHESTHAMQRQLESNHGVRPVYADGPKYLFEATAIFNELLLPDTLARRATDPRLRQFYLEQFLSGKGIDVVYTAAAEAALEQAIYDGVARGEIRNADDLDALTLKITSRYSIWPARDPRLAARWMEIPLMYEDPFYDLNYVWAGLVALNAFAKYERDPAATARGYIALLENGFDRPAADLLRDFLGIDIHAPSFVDDALAVARTRIVGLTAAAAPAHPPSPLSPPGGERVARSAG